MFRPFFFLLLYPFFPFFIFSFVYSLVSGHEGISGEGSLLREYGKGVGGAILDYLLFLGGIRGHLKLCLH